jgi:hypothetical protein
MKKEYLIVLKYSDNVCYTTVVSLKKCNDKHLSVDTKKGTWTYEYGNYSSGRQTYKIGEMRYCDWGCQFGVIGVFDRTDTSQLSRMVNGAKEATTEPRYTD